MTLQEIGDRYGISRQRIGQITIKHGIVAGDGGATKKKLARLEEIREVEACKHLARHGCSKEQRLAAYREGSATGKLHPRVAYKMQKGNAGLHGIAWQMNFWEWWCIWERSGKWPKRGRNFGEYVMARLGSKGPYSVDNVHIISNADNMNGWAKVLRKRPCEAVATVDMV